MPPAIGYVFLAPGASMSRAGFAEHFAATWDEVESAPEIEKGDGTLTFSHKGGLVAIALMPAPFPADDLEGPCQTSWLWPEAAEELAGHKGHLIVTVMSLEENDPIPQRLLLTRVIASVLATSKGTLGVYWGDASLVVSSEMFQEMAAEATAEEPPLPLWCDFRVGPVDQDSGLSFGFTAGMESLGHKELVTQNATDAPGDLLQRLMSIAQYLLSNGPIIEDGNTVGESAEEKITVVFGGSPFGHEGEVMQLDYSSKRKKKRGWFGRG